MRGVLGGPQSCGGGEAAEQGKECLAQRGILGPVPNLTGKASLHDHAGSPGILQVSLWLELRAQPGLVPAKGPGAAACGPVVCGCWAVWVSQVQRNPVVLAQVRSCVHTPVQAKDSDDDDDVTVTVDRDRFMDEFFEQVGAAHLPLPKHWQTRGGHVSPLRQARALTHLRLAQQPTGAS